MKELVFLVEGEAERNLLDALMPRLLPEGMGYRVIPFQGKQDMEKRMGQRIRGYQNATARFIVLRDQDSHTDCVALKQGLQARCQGTGREAQCLVRIACTELETFYLADLTAVAQALDIPSLSKHQENKKFRNPDHLGSPSRELKALTKNRYEKRAGSRAIGQYLSLDNTRSPSFKYFVAGIKRLTAELLDA
ncbi:hypothetical protein LepocDRAFT_00004150 [Leptothrix ochracea L12]|uniref:DUF4276 domain-containing protein n=1 Tax=Leptothrix ochracea L12 TaxID=735332 RepID=I4Z639_9BURK|nr:DUF4276 family protein [Leptothrix ochracea]EIM31681.1 hypothetical protein LepocDRAFT_00004150 [Leptothrix ochracea L12]